MENEDESVPRKLISVASKFPNSDPYWRDRKIELDHYVLFRKEEHGDLPAYFDTNSLAEFHWKSLKKLLIEYESVVKGIPREQLEEKVKEFSYYQQMVLNNLHIVTNYFDIRTVNYYTTVAREVFQTSDMWIRYEFAKGRGEIHSHAIIFSNKRAQKVKEAMKMVTINNNGKPDSQSSCNTNA